MADADTFAKLAGFARKAGLRPEVAEVLARRMGAAGGEPAGTPQKQSRTDMSEMTPAKAPDAKSNAGCGAKRHAPPDAPCPEVNACAWSAGSASAAAAVEPGGLPKQGSPLDRSGSGVARPPTSPAFAVARPAAAGSTMADGRPAEARPALDQSAAAGACAGAAAALPAETATSVSHRKEYAAFMRWIAKSGPAVRSEVSADRLGVFRCWLSTGSDERSLVQALAARKHSRTREQVDGLVAIKRAHLAERCGYSGDGVAAICRQLDSIPGRSYPDEFFPEKPNHRCPSIEQQQSSHGRQGEGVSLAHASPRTHCDRRRTGKLHAATQSRSRASEGRTERRAGMGEQGWSFVGLGAPLCRAGTQGETEGDRWAQRAKNAGQAEEEDEARRRQGREDRPKGRPGHSDGTALTPQAPCWRKHVGAPRAGE
jgi:hypothetical protein